MRMIIWEWPRGGLESLTATLYRNCEPHVRDSMPPSRESDDILFRKLVEAILSVDQWDVWHQDANVAVEWAAPAFKLKGLLGIVDGERDWWPYQVDRHRLRKEGPDAIAREFMEGYRQARQATRQ